MTPSSLFSLALLLLAPALPLPAQTQSALEQDPSGWTTLLPPPDFKGWTRVSIPPTTPIDESTQWTVDPAAGTLHCTGKGGHEWLRTDQEFGNHILHVEWRFAPLPGEPKYNSGVGVVLSRLGEIWHQAQTGPSGAFLFGKTVLGNRLKFVNLRKEMTENRVKPAGEWNTFEVRSESGTISLWINGAVVNRWTGIGIHHGHIGFEAEGYEITFRSIKVKELP